MTVTVINPSVKLIGFTDVNYEWDDSDPESEPHILGMEAEIVSSADDLAEFAGRACYQSFHKPNEYTRANFDYMANIIRQGHESVLEHASATFYIEGVSRAFTHELIRHRHLSYSQLSQRFVDEGRRAVTIPPALRDTLAADLLLMKADEAFDTYEEIVNSLSHLPRKQAREAARAVLPTCTETKIVVTGNMRAWRDTLRKRLDPAADAEIREVSEMILKELDILAPASFQDLTQPE